MPNNRRKGDRVTFTRPIRVHLLAIDGTWRRPCQMLDISELGCRLEIAGSIEGLNLKEFFLLLSTTGRAYRRCELSWVNGSLLGVSFFKAGQEGKTPSRALAKPCGPAEITIV